MSEEGWTPERTLAEKLDHLFRSLHPRGRGEYTYEEVSEGIRQRGGPTISVSYLWLLRKGTRDNPTKKHLQALAEFFGVPVTYFFDDAVTERVDAQLDLLAALRDANVQHLALRAAALSPASLRTITAMVEQARELEGIREPAGRPSRPRRNRRSQSTRSALGSAPDTPSVSSRVNTGQ